MQKNNFKNLFHKKRVLIFGLGLHGGGAGAAAFFHRAGARVTVTDLKDRQTLAPTLKTLRRFRGIRYVLGRHRKKDFLSADLIIRNPGVPDNSPWLRLARKRRIPVSSDIEIFFRSCPAPIIGITGTKGKSTAVSLLGKLLLASRQRVFVGGNIRTSVLGFLPHIKKDDAVVLELSSFQLDMLAPNRVSPAIAGITNIFPDHLNRYKNFSAYVRSKAHIFQFQKRRDRVFLNGGDPILRRLAQTAPAAVSMVRSAHTLQPFAHVLKNRFASFQLPAVALAVAIAESLGVPRHATRQILKTAKPLPGRLEIIRRIRGVSYINDTTATNPGAAIEGLKESKKRFRRVILIAGGAGKKLEARPFAKAIARHAALVIFLPGAATDGLEHALYREKQPPPAVRARSMKEAVRRAREKTQRGDAILLSPGAASFVIFQNEFDRGDQFVHAVKTIAAYSRRNRNSR